MVASGSGGLAAAVVVSISNDGAVYGASVGDCEAWVFGDGEPRNLTEQQVRKPLLGGGDAHPVGFSTQLGSGTLVVASDGLWKYMDHARIAAIVATRPLERAAAALVDGVRLGSGALQDDVAVMLCVVEA
jgi:serine/threonine protein phosphatase PrpC